MEDKCSKCGCDCHKPYKDPKAEENERLFREKMRELNRKKEEARLTQQNACSHIAGSLGTCPDSRNKTAIVWHHPDTRVGDKPTGICMECQREFFPNDADYESWRAKKSFHRDSYSGYEVPLTDEDRTEIRNNGFGTYPPDELWERHFKLQPLDLEDLPDEMIDLLYAEQLRIRKARRGY